MNSDLSALKKYDYLSFKNAKDHGISKYRFYQYVKDNNLVKIDRGIYCKKNNLVDELFLIYQKCPQVVFSHDEAFYFYNLSDREPLVHTLTIYSGYNTHRLKVKSDLKIKIFNVKKELMDVGKVFVKSSFGNEIPMYNLERTICDLVRSRNSIEIQEFTSVLKNYVKRNDKNLNLLMEYAKLFNIDNILKKYMGVLL